MIKEKTLLKYEFRYYRNNKGLYFGKIYSHCSSFFSDLVANGRDLISLKEEMIKLMEKRLREKNVRTVDIIDFWYVPISKEKGDR